MIGFSEVNISQILATYFFGRVANTFIEGDKELSLPLSSRFSNNELRLSISYLFRIPVKNENGVTNFLLVKSNRIPDLYQPPGGVYKYFDNQRLIKLKARDHQFFHEVDDLRIFLPEKNIMSFLKQFQDESWREVGYFREFQEELLDTNILPAELFSHPSFRFLQRRTTGIRWSKHFQCREIIFYDIVDLKINENQNSYLKRMIKSSFSNQYVFASEDSIIRQGFTPIENSDSFRISEHSKQIL